MISISRHDRIFLGEGLFETVRFVECAPMSPELHWQRLEQGAQFLGLNLPVTFDEWYERLVLAIKKQAITYGGVKVILTGGTASRGLTQKGYDLQLIFDVFSYELNSKPLRLISAPWLRDAKNPIYGIKSVDYLEAIIARRYAIANHADDVLFFNMQHNAQETTVANLFVIIDDVLHTPAVSQGILPGVTRTLIINGCRLHGIELREGEINKSMLARASSAFVCNSLQGIQSVHTWDEITYVTDVPIFRQLSNYIFN